MGVNICICDKPSENAVKESSIDCYKKSEPSYYPNIITVNSNNINQTTNSKNNKEEKEKYKKAFKDNRQVSITSNLKSIIIPEFSNNFKDSKKTLLDDNYIEKIIRIQNYYRNYLKRKNEMNLKKNENEKEKEKEKEECLSLRINLEMAETYFSSNSYRISPIMQENINNNKHNNIKEDPNAICPFNIKNKLKCNYKYSGYLKKLKKLKSIISLKNNSENSNSLDKKEEIENEEKSGLVKEGFGKFIFNDGSEFCGIFHENNLKNYGKYSNINQENKDILNKNDKEIIITDNINYEEFIGKYKDYISDGFGIYKNYITNLKITGIFNSNGISGIGIEDSVEGGYVYTGEFNNNKKEGYGTIIWKDGNKYSGQFKDNQLNGYGIIEYPGKKFYQGEVKNGRMDGFGEFFWKDEKRYIGNYKNDKRNGFGVFIFKSNNFKNSISLYEIDKNDENNIDINNMSAYIGFWKNGNMDGFGMKVNHNEIKYGLWEKGTKRKFLDANFALKTYIKWINKKYHKLLLGQQVDIINFMENCLNIDNEICPINKGKS